MTGPRTFTIAIPPRTVLLSANHRPGRYEQARTVRNLRTVAHQLAQIGRIPHLDRVEITGRVHPPDDRHRDPHNWALTLKACIDGLVDARVLTDDNSEVLVRTELVLGAPARFLSFSLEIQEAL